MPCSRRTVNRSACRKKVADGYFFVFQPDLVA